MAADWSYGKLSQDASQNGGPEQYIQNIKDKAFDDGFEEGYCEGNDDGVRDVLIAEGAAAGIAGLVFGLIYLIKEHNKRKYEKRITREAAEASEYVLLERLNSEDAYAEEMADKENCEE